jgi:hypothetical protein
MISSTFTARLRFIANHRTTKIVIDCALFLVMILILGVNIAWTFRTSDPKDFGSFFASGKAFLSNLNPYGYDYPSVFHVYLGNKDVPSPNLNTPVSLYLTSLFSFIPLKIGFPTWQVFSMLLFFLSLFLLSKSFSIPKWRFFWAVCFAGFWHTIEAGQIYVVLFFFMTIAWILNKKKKYILSGIFLGLIVAIKPNFALWMIILLCSGFFKIGISALITTVTVSLIPAFLHGLDIYYQWLFAASVYNGYDLSLNSSFFGLAARLGNIRYGYFPVIIILFFSFYVLYKKKPSETYVHLIGILLSLLCSPIAWPGYLILLIPVMLKMDWNIFFKVLIIYFIVPAPFLYIAVNYSITAWVLLSWFYGFTLLLLFGYAIHEIHKDTNISGPARKILKIPSIGNLNI